MKTSVKYFGLAVGP